MANHPEPILCIPRSEFNNLGAFSGFQPVSDTHNPGDYFRQNPEEGSIATYVVRDDAEQDPSFLQLIPYVVLICGQDIFLYSRNKKGGEARLHEKLSIGIGGHIEKIDESAFPMDTYIAGAVREIEEEVGIAVPGAALQGTVLGSLHDESTDVGKVHLGLLHVLHISPAQAAVCIEKAENTMTDPRWTNAQVLLGSESFEHLEPWSQWALQRIVTLMQAPKPWDNPATRERLQLLAIAGAEVARAAGEMLLQDKGPNWRIAQENVHNALGGLTCVMTGLVTHNELSNRAIGEGYTSYYKQVRETTKHQNWEHPSLQPAQ